MKRKIIEKAQLIFESRCPVVRGYETDSNVVKSWAKKYNVPESLMALFWRRAELLAAKTTKCKKIPYAIAMDIFKASVKKYLSKCDQDIKYVIDNPEIKGQKVKIHYDEARKLSLEEIVERFKNEVRELEKECKGL